MAFVADVAAWLEEAARSDLDSDEAQAILQRISKAGPRAPKAALDEAAATVAESLPDWENPLDACRIAIVIGSLIEFGADPLPPSKAIVAATSRIVADASRFAAALAEATPEPDEESDSEHPTDDGEDDGGDEAMNALADAIAQKMPEEAEAFQAVGAIALAVVASLSRSPEARAQARKDEALLERATSPR